MNKKATQLHDVQFEGHPDGLWNTTRFSIEGTTDIVIVKSRQAKGVKFHIQEGGKDGLVVQTYRFNTVPFDPVKLALCVAKYYAKWEAKKERVKQNINNK